MIEKKKKWKLADFDYSLPEKYIAQYPTEKRDKSKLMVIHKESGEIEHKLFSDLPDYLRKNDLVITNNTKVFPARLYASKDRTDAKVEVFLLRELENDLWEVMVRPARKVRIGNKLMFTDNVFCDVIDNTISGGRVVRFEYDGDDIYDIIDKVGISPLPPYIKRKSEPSDKERYQTVFAEKIGAVAAPTAGLHFTPELKQSVLDTGAQIEMVTLHVGAGTFLPVKSENLSEHKMHSEWGEVTQEIANKINEAKQNNRRVICIGTTSLRIVESIWAKFGKMQAFKGDTDLFITPGYSFQVADILLTNFHLPKSTLLMLVSAFAGFNEIKDAYQYAIKNQYRFFSYGDACLIEKKVG